MGKFDFEISPDFLKTLGKMADVDRIAPQMINEAMPTLELFVKSEIANHKQTGDMYNSIKSTKAVKIKNGGYYAIVQPTGKDKKGVRNMEKLAYLEYGTSKQNAVPTLTKAIKDSQSTVENKMREVFEREVKQK